MEYKEFHGYLIYEDGRIFGLYNRFITANVKNGRKEIRLVVDGKRRHFILARLIYYVFHGFDIEDKNLCVVHKDGDFLNCHIDNLDLKHRKDLIQGEKHTKRAKLTNEQIEEIRNLYKGKSGSNQHEKNSPSLQDLANMYGVSKGNIALIVRRISRDETKYKL